MSLSPVTPRVRKKVVLSAVLLAAVVLLMLWLLGAFHGKVPSAPPQAGAGQALQGVQLEPAKLVTVVATESAVGTVRPVYEAAVASKVLERVVAVNVTAGRQVRKDEVLVQLDGSVLRARVDQAQAVVNAATAGLNNAKAELGRIEEAYKAKVATTAQRDAARYAQQGAEAELQRATQALNEAKANLEFTTVKSPMDGVVIDKKVNVGDMVVPGQVLVAMYDPSRMQLVAPVRESLAQRLTVGQKIEGRIDSMGLVCRGTVEEIVPEAESASRSFLVKVGGPCRPGLYVGMFGRLIIPLGEKPVLVIPVSAVTRVGQLAVVRVAEDGRLVRRAVQLGQARKIDPMGDVVEVLSGLREGEKVAVPREEVVEDE